MCTSMLSKVNLHCDIGHALSPYKQGIKDITCKLNTTYKYPRKFQWQSNEYVLNGDFKLNCEDKKRTERFRSL